MPLAVDAALGLGPAVTLLGTDYPTPDGSCIRDFVHVNDLADAHLRAIDWLRRSGDNGRHEAFQSRQRHGLQRPPGAGARPAASPDDRASCQRAVMR